MIVSTFRKISAPNPLANAVYTTILSFIKNPSKVHLRKITDFRNTKEETLKQNLPVVTWSGMFSYRNSQSILNFSNFIYIDFDKIESVDGTFEKIKNVSFVRAAWKSASNTGLGCIVECEKLDKNTFLPTYSHIVSEFDLKNDHLPDYTRCNVISYDPDIYVNFTSKIYPSKTEIIGNYFKQKIEIPPVIFDSKNEGMFKTNGIFENTPEYFLNLALNTAYKNKGLFVKGNRANFTVSFTGTCKNLGLSEYEVLNFLIANGYWFEDTEKTIKYIYSKY